MRQVKFRRLEEFATRLVLALDPECDPRAGAERILPVLENFLGKTATAVDEVLAKRDARARTLVQRLLERCRAAEKLADELIEQSVDTRATIDTRVTTEMRRTVP